MKKDLTWDLTSLYIDDKELDKDVLKTTKKAKKYNKTYKNSLKKLSSKELKIAILEYESIIESIGKILSYTFLEFATDSKKGSKLNSYQQKCTKISEYILFFELEFNKIDKKTQLQHIKRLKEYEFYLQNLAKEKKHQLSLEAEEIMLKKDLTSSSAWSRMFDEYMAQIEFVHDGKKISEEALLSLLYNKDRKIRKSASIALTKGLEQNKFVLTYIFNMVKSDLKIDNDIRGYKNHESFRHLDNKITQKSVDSLVNTAMSNTKVVSDYYKIKAKLLGIKKLKDYDRYAPIAKSTKKIEYKDAQKMVLKAFKSFDDLEELIYLAQESNPELFKRLNYQMKKENDIYIFKHPIFESIKNRDIFDKLKTAIKENEYRDIKFNYENSFITVKPIKFVFTITIGI